MRILVPKLQTVTLPIAPGQVFDDLYLCIEPETQSFWKTRKPYVPLTSEAAAGIARTLRAVGAKRAVVLTPLEAILQMGAVPAIRNTDELAIVSAGYERLLILRPVSGDQASVKPRSVFEAVGSGVVRVLASYMTPSSMQPIRVRQAAQAAIDLLAELGDGVHIVGAEKLRERVGDPLGAKRPY